MTPVPGAIDSARRLECLGLFLPGCGTFQLVPDIFLISDVHRVSNNRGSSRTARPGPGEEAAHVPRSEVPAGFSARLACSPPGQDPRARSLSFQVRPPSALIALICSSLGKSLARWRSG